MSRVVDVLIVGGGPTGLALANALGMHDVTVLLVEQDPGVAELPRAVSIDDEAMRFMQRLGLRAEAEAVTFPGTGTKYYGARSQVLSYARGPERRRFGFPVKNPIDHPMFQQMLLDGARRFPNVEIRHETQFTSLTQDSEGVTAEIHGAHGAETLTCRYLIGCDGGRSPVRIAIGQEPMSGSAFAERWLVVDTIHDNHDERYAMHHGDPQRPRVIIVGRDGRCRYEFLVHDNEQPDQDQAEALARKLLAPYRSIDSAHIVRSTIYQFYALVANGWSVGRVYLAGDAAHMMPPFAGQGLNSGLRDASNLGWKLPAVLKKQAGPELLASYQAERRPHVQATVRLSVRLGSVMMTLSPVRAFLRDAAFAIGGKLPGFRGFFAELRFRPDPNYALGFAITDSTSVVGAQLRQPKVITTGGTVVDLDDVLGDGFALLGIGVDAAQLLALKESVWTRLNPTKVLVTLDDRLPCRDLVPSITAVADQDGLLAEQLRECRGRVVLVRPDRFIAGSFAPASEKEFATRLEELLGSSASLPLVLEAT
jgi:3-(3-hydroxy-phenyl)propionate hydroxylase